MSEQYRIHRPRTELSRALRIAGMVGGVAGALWFLLAPGGALHGQGTDSNTWFARDAVLGILLCVAGVGTAVHAMLARQKTLRAAHERQAGAFPVILGLAAILGTIVAWRIGVFAGDLFQSSPGTLANPSIVFSLRSGAVLLLWPLASMMVVFVWSMVSYSFDSSPTPEVDSTLA